MPNFTRDAIIRSFLDLLNEKPVNHITILLAGGFYMFEDNMSRYADIINLPRPRSNHKPMSMHDRAAQFSPFSALTGLDDELAETARIVDSKNSKAVNDLKYETLLKLFFGGVTDVKTSINTINKFENEISTSLEILRIYKTNLSINLDNTDHIYYYLTVSFGVEAYEGYLKWCKEAKEMLKKLC